MKQKNLLTLNKIIYYLPIFILIISLATKITLYLYFGTEYWLDENIVTTISKQNLPLLLESVKSEPHPPGFYIFLKLFAVDRVFSTRLILVSISYLLCLLSLAWGYKNKIISEYKLFWGISLFISSYTFLELTADIKQEILSFPIFLLFFFAALKVFKLKERPDIRKLLFLNLLTLLILSLGYLYYLVSILILMLITLKYKESLWGRFLLATQVIIFISYFILYAHEQLLLNANRFSWLNQNYNSFWRALSIHLIGYSFNGVFSDVLVLIFIGAFTLSLNKRRYLNKKVKLIYYPLLIYVSLLAISLYLTHLFVRTRYSSVIFLFLSIFAGWGFSILQIKNPKTKFILLLIILVFFTSSLSSFAKLNVGIFRSAMANIMSGESRKEKFGFLEDHPLEPLTLTLRYKTHLKNVIPLNVYYPDLFKNAQTIEKKDLLVEGKSFDLEDTQIKSLLAEAEVNNFFYWLQVEEKEGYYDPKRKVLKVLEESCPKTKVIPLTYRDILFIFRDCSLN